MQPMDHDDPAFPRLLGEAIAALSYHMCGVPSDKRPPPGGVIQGFDKLAPVYVETTEGRDGPGPAQRKVYSSCADQLHAILARIGVDAKWVNRGVNHVYGTPQMSKLEPFNAKANPSGCPASVYAPRYPAYGPPLGTLCLIWTPGQNNAHALVALGPGSDARHMLTGNYGAGGMSSTTAPGADVADSPCVWDDSAKALLIGGSRRALQCVIEPHALIPYLTKQPDFRGVTFSADLEDGVDLIEALGALS